MAIQNKKLMQDRGNEKFFICHNCGGKFSIYENERANFCPYCGKRKGN